jgi:hypothetical protein
VIFEREKRLTMLFNKKNTALISAVVGENCDFLLCYLYIKKFFIWVSIPTFFNKTVLISRNKIKIKYN